MRKSLETIRAFFRPSNCLTRLNVDCTRRMVHYHVDSSNALTTNHVHAMNNPLLNKLWSKGNKTFQHPSIGRITCDIPRCSGKICLGLCSMLVKKEYVGHATHSAYPGSKFLSYTDFQNAKREQYFVFYKSPVYNYDIEGKNMHIQKTAILNANQDMLIIIHVYSSTKPTIEEIIDATL